MTSRNVKFDRKICGMLQERSSSALTGDRPLSRANERGYTIVALLAVMTIMTLFALAAAPSILQQAQREREKEAIFRGEEMAEAIRIYYGGQASTRGQGEQALPTSIDDLLQGVAIPGRTKKRQVLRASAARDPLSSTGEWRFVRPHSGAMADFVRSLMVYSENLRPTTFDPLLQQQADRMAPPVLVVGGLTGGPLSGDDILDSSTGPFIGVTSRSKQKSVITYYGIDQHNQWVFTPLFR